MARWCSETAARAFAACFKCDFVPTDENDTNCHCNQLLTLMMGGTTVPTQVVLEGEVFNHCQIVPFTATYYQTQEQIVMPPPTAPPLYQLQHMRTPAQHAMSTQVQSQPQMVTPLSVQVQQQQQMTTPLFVQGQQELMVSAQPMQVQQQMMTPLSVQGQQQMMGPPPPWGTPPWTGWNRINTRNIRQLLLHDDRKAVFAVRRGQLVQWHAGDWIAEQQEIPISSFVNRIRTDGCLQEVWHHPMHGYWSWWQHRLWRWEAPMQRWIRHATRRELDMMD